MGNANCSVDEVCQLLAEDSVEITKQGLDFRFTPEAVKFMDQLTQAKVNHNNYF